MSTRDGPTQRWEAFHFSTREFRRGRGVFWLSGPIRSWWPSKGIKDVVGSHSQKNLVFLWLFVLFGSEPCHVAWARKIGFQFATDEVWWILLCVKREAERRHCVDMQNMGSLCAEEEQWRLCVVFGRKKKRKNAIFVWNKPKKIGAHPPFSFSLHMQWVSGCSSLPTPPSPQRALILCIAASPRCLWFQELNYSATFVDVVLQVNAAELCSSWNCSSSLTAEGRNPPSSAMLCKVSFCS